MLQFVHKFLGPKMCFLVCMLYIHCVVGLDKPPALSTSETAELEQTIQDLHKLQASQRQEIVQRDTQIEKLVRRSRC